ncbi:dimethylsulfonioproprionate lyase family protein [Rhizobium sp. NXC24]|uniref:dimethylsulfonioproprionate lyase family protein n=1 Tax=Rhizobium sp. NXC24 TaxID=2048897 RepID=UPI00131A5D36|nr:dimethylsulfonioproprionate lyase family protein [Rhizobium sp. NXC24]
MMAKFVGCKIIHLLSNVGHANPPRMGHRNFPLRSHMDAVCEASKLLGPELTSIGCGLIALMDDLDWYRGQSGAYASVNFADGHAHAILVGPGGLEERSDVRMGVTLLAPYTRFPDHWLTYSRVILPISQGEFRIETGEWQRVEPGSLQFHPTGHPIAIRCTSKPFLALWAQKLSV